MHRRSLLAFLLLLPAAPALGNVNEAFAELFGRPGPDGVKASYLFQQYESRPLRQGEAKLGLRQQAFSASVPISTKPERKWKILANAELDDIRTKAAFTGNRSLPSRLWNVGAGLSHTRTLEGSRVLGGSFLLGSSSDRPFAAARDFSFQLNVNYKVPAGGEDAWIFFLSLANNRSVLNYLPMPGFAYLFRAHEKVRIALGIPFMAFFWSPFDKAVFNLTYFPVYNAQAKFSYFLFGPAHVFAQVKYQSKNFFLSDRAEKRERFFIEEANAMLGLATPLTRFMLVDLNAGYSFDRKFFLGKNSLDREDGRIVRADSAPFASLRLVSSF